MVRVTPLGTTTFTGQVVDIAPQPGFTGGQGSRFRGRNIQNLGEFVSDELARPLDRHAIPVPGSGDGPVSIQVGVSPKGIIGQGGEYYFLATGTEGIDGSPIGDNNFSPLGKFDYSARFNEKGHSERNNHIPFDYMNLTCRPGFIGKDSPSMPEDGTRINNQDLPDRLPDHHGRGIPEDGLHLIDSVRYRSRVPRQTAGHIQACS